MPEPEKIKFTPDANVPYDGKAVRRLIALPVLLLIFFVGYGALPILAFYGRWSMEVIISVSVGIHALMAMAAFIISGDRPDIFSLKGFFAKENRISANRLFFLLGIANFVLLYAFELLLKTFRIPYSEAQDNVNVIFDSPLRTVCFMFFYVVIAVPLIEEYLFRHYLYQMLRPFGIWPAILLTSLVFAIVHFYLLGFACLWMMGILFQIAYLKTGRLSSSILLHMANNLATFLTILIARNVFL